MGPLPPQTFTPSGFSASAASSLHHLPDFDNLPRVEGMPQGCAWGIFDINGTKDVFGTLNLLTPDVVQEAQLEIQQGISISLDWPLDSIENSPTGRKGLIHSFLSLHDMGLATYGWDDEINFNTQISSHWDSFCHYPHQTNESSYNGLICSKNKLTKNSSMENGSPTLDSWHRRGGVVGRGVLLDYNLYAKTNGIPFSPFDGTSITVQDLELVAAFQNVTFRPGDIPILRTGYTEGLSAATTQEERTKLLGQEASGLNPSLETARWVWNNHFAAFAGDSIALEAISLNSTGPVNPEFLGLPLHQWFLDMFGLPIGELWDLRKLSAHCRKVGKYTFFLTSVPLNVPGLVGSPPNALALF